MNSANYREPAAHDDEPATNGVLAVHPHGAGRWFCLGCSEFDPSLEHKATKWRVGHRSQRQVLLVSHWKCRASWLTECRVPLVVLETVKEVPHG